MADSLNVIALISGGKDSFYSILHCIQNGHKVIALGNLYPQQTSKSHEEGHVTSNDDFPEEESDLNSWMYQTVGHSIIPLYAQALGLPLFRQVIAGTAVNDKITYHPPTTNSADETESLLPLLRTIIAAHPEANAISTGAILSTYQRTRVESVALRLGLTPLSYLWQYPNLTPRVPSSLLQDMQAAGMDARIIKVASGGLDESFLWENVASTRGMTRVEKATSRFGSFGDGAVLGEGGEFETLVIDGPSSLFKGKIAIDESTTHVVREGGGSSWLGFREASVEMKTTVTEEYSQVRVPAMWDAEFKLALDSLSNFRHEKGDMSYHDASIWPKRKQGLSSLKSSFVGTCWTAVNQNLKVQNEQLDTQTQQSPTIEEEAQEIVNSIRSNLSSQSLGATDIAFTTIVLRSMSDFAAINKIYGTLFPLPNPPARVTVAVGSALPEPHNIVIHLVIDSPVVSVEGRRALHVQSRSYWAPANIGPYSQARTVPLQQMNTTSPDYVVYIAGQIPLVPSCMALPFSLTHNDSSSSTSSAVEDFNLQTMLSLQHLHRVAVEMSVSSFLGAIAYVPRSSPLATRLRSRIAAKAWLLIHRYPKKSTENRTNQDDDEGDSDSDNERDLWEERHHGALLAHTSKSALNNASLLPNYGDYTFDLEVSDEKLPEAPPIFTAEVEELPRGSGIEWQSLLGLIHNDQTHVSVYRSSDTKSSTVYTLKLHTITFSIAVVPYSTEGDVTGKDVREEIELLKKDGLVFASWVDVGIATGLEDGLFGLGEVEESDGSTGVVVPCHSLWDADGHRVAAVVVIRSENS